jgi:hypothetical protein
MATPHELTEISQPRQIPGEPARRWFTSADMDLVVWLDDSRQATGFQLCYGKPLQERALTWWPGQGFRHHAVDDGSRGGIAHKNTPLLLADGNPDPEQLLALFRRAAARLPADIVHLVAGALARYPDVPHE